ncbi:tripartite tricarboxylate transporter substrate binding protein BugE [Noviherbaspirillum suwonense]|uniref:Tripartite-type tricarboxylate transporter, receptor component TctC n=1 Tax=Noviherbaspirillum suwonense TaxID=1224511 RepID=A0ABY1PQK4_9BURK|nr:tripartite tricarboxylate transporter substrate binding protein BugE [Noviherbaspirillum suwonense]SMP42675.1 Tripartite-type tricarboxylate transporter, receptor component TctC [Noviherbaspirillum suwonense]
MKLKTTLLACTLAFSASAYADTYPSKPITLIVPFAPGGTTDLVARVVADKMGKELGQTVVVENRAGAGGALGANAVARAAPDGYTLGISTISTHAVNAACNPQLPYDPIASFTPITNLARTPNVLTAAQKFPAQDFKQLLDLVKKNPGKFNYASSGVCSVLHMMGEQFKVSTGTFITHMPYRGSGPALIDLLGGQVEMMFDNLPSSMGHIQTGKIRAIAVAAPKRVEGLPNVPTFAELGLPQVNDPAWYGLVAPAKTPEAIVNRLNAAAAKVLSLPDVRDKLKQSGSESAANTPAQHAAEIKHELEKAKAVVQKQGIKFENS